VTGGLEGVGVEDRLALQQLVATYSWARDDKDIDGLVAHFEADAEFERAGRVVRGHEGIRDFFAASMQRYDLTIHVTHSQAVHALVPEGGIDLVAGTVAGHAELVLDAVPHQAAYRYADVYARTDAGWRFRRRSLRFIYAMPVEELPAGFGDPLRVRWRGSDPQRADLPEGLPTWTDRTPG
jgi:ketosteroid isomerase-like protein